MINAIYPVLFRNVILPMEDMALRTSVSRTLRAYSKSEWWSADRMTEYQDEKVVRLLRHAYENVPYYKRVMDERGIQPGGLTGVVDLARFPLLTREMVRRERDNLKSRDLKSRRAKINSTGGTTGEPLRYYADWSAWSADWASLYRGWGYAGYRPGDKIATLAGSSLMGDVSVNWKQALRVKLERNLPLSVASLSPEIARRHASDLSDFRPRFVRGYPTALFVFARHVRSLGLSIPGLTGIMTTAEMLRPEHRQTIEEVLQAPVFDGYGCRDGGAIAMECDRHLGMHICSERGVFQFLDDEENPAGTGRIVTTDLLNYAMPFIRYETGDRGTLAPEPCPCGRGLPLIQSLDGRTTDVLTFHNGRTLSGPATTLMFRDSTFLAYQLRQTADDLLQVSYVADDSIDVETQIEPIRAMLENHVGSDVRIEFRLVDDIPATRAGKRRFIISDL